jgi:hypothetical protein
MEGSYQITIYAKGLVHCSVCCPKELTREEIEAHVNMENPTGIDSKWKISDEAFASGEANPSVCEKNANRLHYLLVC